MAYTFATNENQLLCHGAVILERVPGATGPPDGGRGALSIGGLVDSLVGPILGGVSVLGLETFLSSAALSALGIIASIFMIYRGPQDGGDQEEGESSGPVVEGVTCGG